METPLEVCTAGETWACCGVHKDGGDDVDVTHGALICARVEFQSEPGIRITGGIGVGTVTKPGLNQPVGESAINRVPRQMITQAVEDVCRLADETRGLLVTVTVPEGERLAGQTFNPNLGIQGGISILGTSGIVEPMSTQALIDTIGLELKQTAAQGADKVILTPGNYGLDFLQKTGMDRWGVPVVRCSNFLGESLDLAGDQGYRQVLLVGHIGKLVKVAAGIMNTHSRMADGRTEVLCAHAAAAGASQTLCQALLESATTDACLDLLQTAGLLPQVMDAVLKKIQFHLDRRAAGRFQTGAVVFSNERGELGRTAGAKEIIQAWT